MSKGNEDSLRAPQSVERYVARRKAATIGDLRSLGLSRPSLYRALAALVAQGRLIRVQRGHYQVATRTEPDGWVLIQRQYPRGVICLLSALAFHSLTTQSPREAWIALPKGAWRKAATYPPARIVHFSGKHFITGIEEHPRPGGTVKVYSAAKTVADCFKFRNQIGLDVAIEALREGWRERRFTLEQLDRMASICRVQAVMRPYIEALVA
jgi:predicted transcriptional regulator of viral defense system